MECDVQKSYKGCDLSGIHILLAIQVLKIMFTIICIFSFSKSSGCSLGANFEVTR